MDSCTTFVNVNLRQPAHETNTTIVATTGNNTTSQNCSEQPTHTLLHQIRENDDGTYLFETVEHPAVLSIPYNQTFANSAYPTLRFNPLARLHIGGPSNSQPELNVDYSLSRPRFDYTLDHIEVLEDEKRKRRYYKFKIFPFFHVKIYFNRLSLDALLDYNETYFETFLCILLAVVVSFLGAVMLHLHYYHDIPAFLFCFVIATSHYSLLKSVQPDASSPVHGFNKVVAYSRPIYFILCCSVIVGLHWFLKADFSWLAFRIYQVDCNPQNILQTVHDFLCTFVLFFPLFFTLGMFPQVNTFMMYIFEQVDMHVFGGSAVTSLKAAVYCVFRSLLAVLFLFGFAYGGLNEPKSSQHILFSIFITLLVMFAYHLSRCTCDPAPIWNILVKHFWPIDEPAKLSQNSQKAKPERKAIKTKKPKKKISGNYSKDVKTDASSGDRELGVQINNSSSLSSSNEHRSTGNYKIKFLLIGPLM